jgi:ParB-like chromosome segregation protein Spo0J
MDEIKNFDIEQVDVNVIKLDETNPNEMSHDKMDALRKIMKEKGMLQPILIDQNNMMIDGEDRYIVYKEFGMKKIPCFRMNVTDLERRLLLLICRGDFLDKL